jgi:hypothetical protein
MLIKYYNVVTTVHYDGLASPGGIHATSGNPHAYTRSTTAPQKQPHSLDVT